ncbi:hypothetical protein BJY21_001424 [Kineosphaera limosa]|uniref:Uncharacterized protein n=1 Tax=Kineosphaera limosa NBRC 100340 TaxID=1184609 RepID=K6XFM7_9MICO|nr:hypothetical protein [Kineosphaera limosa]NYE00240.1 hypothetical protein [Kineosphaera limosa]GAB97649.1 hypothetical protein KILIM_077_00060 [Kineosphaera limosa NBRC 100340]
MYSMCASRVDDGYRYTVIDGAGHVLDSRTSARVYRGAVVALSEMSEHASVWSWHPTPDAARNAAATLRRKRPEILVSAVTS